MMRAVLLAAPLALLAVLALGGDAAASHSFSATPTPAHAQPLEVGAARIFSFETVSDTTGAEQVLFVAPAELDIPVGPEQPSAPSGYAASYGRFASGVFAGRSYVEFVGARSAPPVTFAIRFVGAAAPVEGARPIDVRMTTPGLPSHTTSAAPSIVIDGTPPTITFESRTPANGNGWNNGPVTVAWTCSDALSGAVAPRVEKTQSAETSGATLAGTCTDRAGNTASADVSGIRVDTTAPSIAYGGRTPTPNGDGWVRSTIVATWTCGDALSGPEAATVTASLATETSAGSLTGTCRDLAGNPASDTIAGLKLDLTRPLVTITGRTNPNANGWNNVPVSVDWSCADSLSGPASPTGSLTVSAEGDGQTATASCVDRAGWTATHEVIGIRIDRTAPSILLASRTPANAAGWNRGDVAVEWTCTDSLSGPAAPTVAATIAGEGNALQETGTCADLAGNTASATETAKIDRTPPGIAVTSRTPANAAGWNRGDVAVEWTCTDSLSGPVDATRTATIAGEGGALSASATCEDAAGNSASHTETAKIDRTPPSIARTARTPTNAAGWNRGDVAVEWSCADVLSGPAAPTVSATITGEGAALSATGTCLDVAGNSAASVEAAKIDRAPPTATFAGRTPAENGHGWARSPITATWTCADGLSGPVEPSVSATLSTETAAGSLRGTCADAAGNEATGVLEGLKLDMTRPVLTVTGRSPANANGWNNGDVTVTWTCADSLSSPVASTGSTTLSAEGDSLSALATCEDLAGWTATETVADIRIDRTAPSISVASRTRANAAGWNRGDVEIEWTCADALSGVVDATRTATITGEGAALSATETCVDRAGNPASHVESAKIDRIPPSIHFASRTPANAHGWNRGDVTVTWSCADSLSGPAAPTVSATVVGEGERLLAVGTCADAAGNMDDATHAVNIDRTPPQISFAGRTAANAAGWNAGEVTATWTCADLLSGAAASTVEAVQTADTSGATLAGTCEDLAGNEATSSIGDIRIDRTPPTIAYASRTPSPNADGWATSNITVTWTCADDRSGPEAPTVFATLSSETASGVLTGTCRDLAGNAASANETGLKLDRTPPVVTVTGRSAANPHGWHNGPATLSWTCADSLSGPAETSGNATLAAEGRDQSLVATCADRAGLAATKTEGGFHLDLTAPTITLASRTQANAAGWNRGDVAVAWSCSDALSGAAAPTASALIDGEGDALSATGTCRDLAGNEARASESAKIDRTEPDIFLASRTPANVHGWNRDNVSVVWTCADALSGPVAPSVSATQTEETDNGTLTASCSDAAGNSATARESGIRLDRTPPSVSYASRTPEPNARGWAKEAITVTWTCSDARSGPAAPTTSATLSAETADGSLTGTCADHAGNTASATETGLKLDMTRPAIDGLSRTAANEHGWNNGPVTVTWACADALSGALAAGGDVTLAEEGAGQAATASCEDAAGWKASSALSGIHIDLSPPGIRLSTRTSPNAAGWNRGNVVVTWSCSDALSEPVSPSVTRTITGEGRGLVANGTCTDRAGNTATATETADIDRSAPAIALASRTPANVHGWNREDVAVTWTCSDSLSGAVAATISATQTAETNGTTLKGFCEDHAGNSATAAESDVRIDRTAPGIVYLDRTPEANAHGWAKEAIMVRWSCSDARSGALAAVATATLTAETANGTLSGTCEDRAGNRVSASVSGLKLDLTPPGVASAVRTAPNPHGWNNGPVALDWTCADSLSGPLAPTGRAIATEEGANQTLTARCEDRAGWTATQAVDGIHIDLTLPAASRTHRTEANPRGWNNHTVTVAWSCSDALSGALASSLVAEQAEETSNATLSARCEDRAGNAVTAEETDIRVDRSEPSIKYAGRTPGENAHGWAKESITVTWTCSDARSGALNATASATLAVETANGTLSGTCEDRAGNRATARVSDLKLDMTRPDVSGVARTAANRHGWNNADVAVTWTCTDGLSGALAATGAVTLAADGANQTATARCEDLAGWTATILVEGIHIDRVAPEILPGSRTPANAHGWNRDDVTVTWICRDSLSGAVEGSIARTIKGEGANLSATAACEDLAGNTRIASESARIDRSPPSISPVSRTPANARGWNNGTVTVTWGCADGLSGPRAPSVHAAHSTETNGTTLVGTCEDLAGNTASAEERDVRIDTTSPSIDYAGRTPEANAHGWAKSAITATWTCGDARSGALAAKTTATLVAETANGTLVGTCEDHAGNRATARVTGLKLDLSAPAVAGVTRTAANPHGWNNATVTVAWGCTDAVSGVLAATGSVALDREGANQSATARCEDLAGWTATSVLSGIHIDLSLPEARPTSRTAANAHGWNNGDVEVAWACADGLSGPVASALAATITGEGAALSRTVVCSDRAGNHVTATETANIDRKPPAIEPVSRTPANARGWNAGDVRVEWTCADALSGPAVPRVSATIVGEGRGLSATGMCFDRAGNVATATERADIDRTRPAITLAQRTPATSHGWNAGDVVVDWTCADTLSGVVNGSIRRTIAGEGANLSATATCEDQAGNSASDVATAKIDRAKPSIALVRRTSANAHGWNNGDVVFGWSCADSLSGPVSPSVETTLGGEGAALVATGVCEDLAGNAAFASESARIDRTPPTGSLVRRTPANTAGWNTGDVTVEWACSDALAGPVAVSTTVTIGGEGAGRTGSSRCEDLAGNVARLTETARIDRTAPLAQVLLDGVAATVGWRTTTPALSAGATDALSGVASAEVLVDGAPYRRNATLADGTYEVVAVVRDLAGHQSVARFALQVDSVAPTASLTIAPGVPDGSGGWYATRPRVTLAGTDGASGLARFEYRVANGSFQAYEGPFTLPEGANVTVEVAMVDAAGNAFGTRAAPRLLGGFRVDATPPGSPTLTLAASPGAVNVTWGAVDATNLTLERSVAGGAFSVLARLPAGAIAYRDADAKEGVAHAYRLLLADAAGHANRSAVATLTPDWTPPKAPEVRDLGLVAGSPEVRVAFQNGTTAAFRVLRDGAVLFAGNLTDGRIALPSDLGAGAFTIEVAATDEAGNRLDWTPAASFTVKPDLPVVENLRGVGRVDGATGVVVTGRVRNFARVAELHVEVDGNRTTVPLDKEGVFEIRVPVASGTQTLRVGGTDLDGAAFRSAPVVVDVPDLAEDVVSGGRVPGPGLALLLAGASLAVWMRRRRSDGML